MKNRVLILSLIILAGISLTATAGNDWKTSFSEATNAAAYRNLPILAYFSASDTSEDCKRFDFLVLRRPEFQKFASANFILFQADLPRKHPLPDDIKNQNYELIKLYRVNKCPTVLLLNYRGQTIPTINLTHDGKSNALQYIETLKKAINK